MKKRAIRILKWLGGIVITLAIIYGVMMAPAVLALHRATKALKADGRPMTYQDIAPPKIPDQDNAALVYERVVLKLKEEKVGETDLWDALGKAAEDVLSESPGADSAETFRLLYDRSVVTKAMADVEEGSLKSGYWNDNDFEKGIEMLLPQAQTLLNLSRILCAGVRLQSEAGDHAAAWDSALTALRVANAARDEPITTMQLVRMAQFKVAMDVIQGLPYSEAAHQKVDALLSVCEDPTPLVNAVDMERIGLDDCAFRNPRFGRIGTRKYIIALVMDGTYGLPKISLLNALFPPRTKRDHAALLASLHALAPHMLKPWSPADPEFYREVLENVPDYCLITRLIVPVISSTKDRLVSRTAQARVIRAGLAVLKERAARGAWPEALPANDDLLDPFTGNPLIYKPSPQGFVLYSVGKDLFDVNWDIVWRYSEE